MGVLIPLRVCAYCMTSLNTVLASPIFVMSRSILYLLYILGPIQQRMKMEIRLIEDFRGLKKLLMLNI
jgi:hypothetical protein